MFLRQVVPHDSNPQTFHRFGFFAMSSPLWAILQGGWCHAGCARRGDPAPSLGTQSAGTFSVLQALKPNGPVLVLDFDDSYVT